MDQPLADAFERYRLAVLDLARAAKEHDRCMEICLAAGDAAREAESVLDLARREHKEAERALREELKREG